MTTETATTHQYLPDPIPEEWEWYGTWVIDWLGCDDPWEGKDYDFWKEAYLNAYDYDWDTSDLNLAHNHYWQALKAYNNSPVASVAEFFQNCALPWQKLQDLCQPIIRAIEKFTQAR